MKKILSPLIVIIAVAFMLVSCGEQSAEKSAKQATKHIPKVVHNEPAKTEEPACNLTMGWDPWEPYQYLTPDNKVRGLEIDLISSIAKEAGCTIKFVQNDWMRLLKGIRNGSIDMLGGASKTASREKFAIFSDPYRRESFVLYIRSDQQEEFFGKSLQQLIENKFMLGVTEDYMYGDEVLDMQDNQNVVGQIIGVPITEMNYFNLLQHQIDGFLEDPFVAAYTIKRKGLSEKIVATSIEFESGDVSFMFSKASVTPATVEAFNRGLKVIKESGTYDEILKKYSH